MDATAGTDSAPRADARPVERVAAVDVGSNTVRCLAVCLFPSGVARSFGAAETMTALGRGLSESGRMAPEAIAATADFVARFLADSAPLERVFCAGTAAARDATNADDLYRALRERAGVGLEILSGPEEARLSYIGAVSAVAEPDARPLVADIGGRSTELAALRAGRIRGVSFPLGARSVTERFLASDPPSRAELMAARRAARAAPAGGSGWTHDAGLLIGVGGTAVSAALLAGGAWAMGVGRLARVRRRLCKMGLRERREAMPFDPERAEIICGGLVILESLVEMNPGRRLVISPRGLREGLLLARTGARCLEPPPSEGRPP